MVSSKPCNGIGQPSDLWLARTGIAGEIAP
jgi:hypothetical protein